MSFILSSSPRGYGFPKRSGKWAWIDLRAQTSRLLEVTSRAVTSLRRMKFLVREKKKSGFSFLFALMLIPENTYRI